MSTQRPPSRSVSDAPNPADNTDSRAVTETQFGLRNELGNVLPCTTEQAADEHLARYGPDFVQVVTREVTPWTPRDDAHPAWCKCTRVCGGDQ